jgi:thymidylate synthase
MTTDIDSIKDAFVKLKAAHPFGNAPAGMLEMLGVSFVANRGSIFGEPNRDYIRRELDWYLSESLSVNDIEPPVPAIWRDIASRHGEINSNYGALLFGGDNHRQYQAVTRTLRQHEASRRAVAVYTRPTIHMEWNRDGMADFICTNAVQYLVRDGRLHCIVQMRSNDVVYGYRNDWAWQQYVLEMMVRDLWDTYPQLEPGTMVWQVGSLHVYPRHFDLVHW